MSLYQLPQLDALTVAWSGANTRPGTSIESWEPRSKKCFELYNILSKSQAILIENYKFRHKLCACFQISF